jgi:hypothetical protein
VPHTQVGEIGASGQVELEDEAGRKLTPQFVQRMQSATNEVKI